MLKGDEILRPVYNKMFSKILSGCFNFGLFSSLKVHAALTMRWKLYSLIRSNRYKKIHLFILISLKCTYDRSYIFIALTKFYATHRNYDTLSKSLVPNPQSSLNVVSKRCCWQGTQKSRQQFFFLFVLDLSPLNLHSHNNWPSLYSLIVFLLYRWKEELSLLWREGQS